MLSNSAMVCPICYSFLIVKSCTRLERKKSHKSAKKSAKFLQKMSRREWIPPALLELRHFYAFCQWKYSIVTHWQRYFCQGTWWRPQTAAWQTGCEIPWVPSLCRGTSGGWCTRSTLVAPTQQNKNKNECYINLCYWQIGMI